MWHLNTLGDVGLALAGIVVLSLLLCSTRNLPLFRNGCLKWIMMGCGLVSVLLLFPVKSLLEVHGLTWRNGPAGFFALVLLLSISGLIVLAIKWVFQQKMNRMSPSIRAVVKTGAIAALSLIRTVFLVVGVFLTAFAYGYRERVLTDQGRQFVEQELIWLDVSYVYYPCHGILLRGTERVEITPDEQSSEI